MEKKIILMLHFGTTTAAAALLFSLPSCWAAPDVDGVVPNDVVDIDCATIQELGTPSLERFDFSLMMVSHYCFVFS